MIFKRPFIREAATGYSTQPTQHSVPLLLFCFFSLSLFFTEETAIYHILWCWLLGEIIKKKAGAFLFPEMSRIPRERSRISIMPFFNIVANKQQRNCGEKCRIQMLRRSTDGSLTPSRVRARVALFGCGVLILLYCLPWA